MTSEFRIKHADELSKLAGIFDTNGFALIDNVFNETEIEEMRSAMREIVEKMNPDEHPQAIFTTTDENKVGSNTLLKRDEYS